MRRALVVAAVVCALVVGGVAANALWPLRGTPATPAGQTKLPPATAEVTRMTLVDTKTLTGTLAYGDPVPVGATVEGVLTWIAPVGSTVKRGAPLFRINQQPIVAMYGAVPLYRPLRPGVVGADVKEFERNLFALGYRGYTVDDTFTVGTGTAVKDWQTDLQLPVTGTVDPGQVVFTPGPVRIAAQVARVGQRAGQGQGDGTVLSYTSTSRLITVNLKVADQGLATVGGKVTVTIPGGKRLDGTITDVGTVAKPQDQGAEGAAPTGPVATDATLAVTIQVADQKALGTLEAAPVDVDFVSEKREGVLTVPVAALLALPAGGYGVEVVEGSTTRIVAVEPGLFAGGRVEIRGDGITEGMKVGIPQ